MSSLNLHFGYTITKYIIYETGDTSLPSSPLPGRGCGLSTGHGVPHAVAGLILCLQDIGG